MTTKKSTAKRRTASRGKKKKATPSKGDLLKNGLWSFATCLFGIACMYVAIKEWDWSLPMISMLSFGLSCYALGTIWLLNKPVRSWVTGMFCLLWTPGLAYLVLTATTFMHRSMSVAAFLLFAIGGILLIYKDIHREEE